MMKIIPMMTVTTHLVVALLIEEHLPMTSTTLTMIPSIRMNKNRPTSVGILMKVSSMKIKGGSHMGREASFPSSFGAPMCEAREKYPHQR
jgi:hypothetical protein